MSAVEKLLTPEQLADVLGIAVETVYDLNYKRTGPRITRIGRLPRYAPADVTAWMRARREPATP